MNAMTTVEAPQIGRRYMLQAQSVARYVPRFLLDRKLAPAFDGWFLTTWQGIVLLVGVLDTNQIGDQERYKGKLVHQLSTNLKGIPVYISNSTGLRYVFQLNRMPRLPKRIDLPQLEHGQVGLGQSYDGQQVVTDWRRLGHVLAAGKTRSGKSTFLRALVYQALRDEMQLVIADNDRVTFPMLAEHPALLTPMAFDPGAALAALQRVMGECDHRAGLFEGMSGYPEDLDEYNRLAVKAGAPVLPRVLVVLDEFNNTLMQSGNRSNMSELLGALGMRALKFGVNIVFAAHEFTKEQIGLLRPQCETVVCFRTEAKEMSTRMHCAGAERIPQARQGLAVTNKWGPVQAYYLDKSRLIGQQAGAPREALSDVERAVFTRALENGGRVTLALIQDVAGESARQANKLQKGWALRGWIIKDAEQDNAYVLGERGMRFLGVSDGFPPDSRGFPQFSGFSVLRESPEKDEESGNG